jgi:hypothetical protein
LPPQVPSPILRTGEGNRGTHLPLTMSGRDPGILSGGGKRMPGSEAGHGEEGEGRLPASGVTGPSPDGVTPAPTTASLRRKPE